MCRFSIDNIYFDSNCFWQFYSDAYRMPSKMHFDAIQRNVRLHAIRLMTFDSFSFIFFFVLMHSWKESKIQGLCLMRLDSFLVSHYLFDVELFFGHIIKGSLRMNVWCLIMMRSMMAVISLTRNDVLLIPIFLLQLINNNAMKAMLMRNKLHYCLILES